MPLVLSIFPTQGILVLPRLNPKKTLWFTKVK